MVNENKGKVYEPVPVYNRKLIRSVIKNRVIKKNGLHNVNKYMHDCFEEFKDKNITLEYSFKEDK